MKLNLLVWLFVVWIVACVTDDEGRQILNSLSRTGLSGHKLGACVRAACWPVLTLPRFG